MTALPPHYTPGRYSVRAAAEGFVVVSPGGGLAAGCAPFTTRAAAQERSAHFDAVRAALAAK